MSEAPKRIWAVPSMGIHGWADGLCSDTPTSVGKKASDEYILASEHARLMAEAERRAYERAAKVVEDNSEWVRSSDNSRNLQPRGKGDMMGLGYAAAIRAMAEKE